MANGKYNIGLNETLLVIIFNIKFFSNKCSFFLQIQGIQPPFWLCEAMINTIGFRNGEKACHFGELYSTEDALKLNLIDKLVDLKDIKTESENAMKDWLKIPSIYTQKYL